jgi:hypothetical protein
VARHLTRDFTLDGVESAEPALSAAEGPAACRFLSVGTAEEIGFIYLHLPSFGCICLHPAFTPPRHVFFADLDAVGWH